MLSSLSGARLRKLGCGQFRGHSVEGGLKSGSKRGPLSVTRVYPSLDHIKSGFRGTYKVPHIHIHKRDF